MVLLQTPSFVTPLRSWRLFAFFDRFDPCGVRSLLQSRLWHQGGCLCFPSPVHGFRRCSWFPYRELLWSRSPKGFEIVNYFLWKREPAALQLVRFAKNRGYRLFLKTLIQRSWRWVTFISRVCGWRKTTWLCGHLKPSLKHCPLGRTVTPTHPGGDGEELVHVDLEDPI